MHPCFFKKKKKRKENYAYKKRQKLNSLRGFGVNLVPLPGLNIVLIFYLFTFLRKKQTAVSAGSGRSHHAAQLLLALACAGCAALSSTDCSISTPKETKRSNETSHSLEKVALLRQMIR